MEIQGTLFRSAGPGSVGKVRIGTSGYQYPDWVGPWYPSGMSSRNMLSYYCQHFDTVELNSSYYGMPRRSTAQRLTTETPDGFLTVVKAYKGMTHKFEGWDIYDQFREALEPLMTSGKLGGILFQFPPWFQNDVRRRRYLKRLPDLLPGVPIIVEFRDRQWIKPATFALLEDAGIAYCCVDEPDLPELVPPVAHVTSPLGYLRFHSRDAGGWYGGGETRYDYDYGDAELEEWVEKILTLMQSVKQFIVYFNNCKRSSAAHNAERFRQILEQRLPGASGARPAELHEVTVGPGPGEVAEDPLRFSADDDQT